MFTQNTWLSLFKLKNVSIPLVVKYFTLLILFFGSGCAALIYQVMWERLLFISFGIDLQSITIVVAVFMLGLGLGGITGGYLADTYASNIIKLYFLFEFIIAVFGFCSPYLINAVGHWYVGEQIIFRMIINFLLLALPTTLMGATFPLLVKLVNDRNQNIGQSVGSLYMANTLGGAVGAYFAGFIALYIFDISGTIYCAAWLNLCIALICGMIFRGNDHALC